MSICSLGAAYQDQEISTVFDVGGSYLTGSGFSWVSGVTIDTSETGYTKAFAVGDDYWVPVGSAGATTGQAQIFVWDFAGHPYVATSFVEPTGASATWSDLGAGTIESWFSHFQTNHSGAVPSPTVWKN